MRNAKKYESDLGGELNNMVPQKSLEKYKELHWKLYKVKLSDEEATESVTHFLNLMKILIYPDPKRRP